jgi:thiamine-monophosphate kinase
LFGARSDSSLPGGKSEAEEGERIHCAAMLPEHELIELIAAVAGSGDDVVLGIGDDAAVLRDGLVVSADMLVEGVHFDLARLDAHAVGARAAAANLSDLAAMGARPLCLVAAFGLPDGFSEVPALAAGLASYGVPLAGGDLSRAPVLTVSVTAIGRAQRPVTRSGGRPGDRLVVTGDLGGQAVSGYTRAVRPRLDEGEQLAEIAGAMIDLSDGIAGDVRLLAAASGCGATVWLERLPRSPGASVEQAATGGEDFELLAAVPPGPPLPAWVTEVGTLTEGDAVLLLDQTGAARDLQGWDHFR